VPGVSVRGGNSSIITLPSFGGDGTQPAAPGRSPAGTDDHPSLTVEASPRSGGAFNFYGLLKGDKVYTIYIDTVLGTAVLEFADPTSADHPSMRDLTPPQPVRADLPAGVRRSRLVIACVLDRTGLVRNAQVLESSGQAMAAKVLAALPSWKFRPAMRGNQAVEVNAILGFDIDTNDRY
jgi:TonB family protein